jgi:hypothetical protein
MLSGLSSIFTWLSAITVSEKGRGFSLSEIVSGIRPGRGG